MSARERRNSAEESGSSNAWMVTFSDLIMLLLTFFVLLLTMSSLDQKALKEIISHLRDSTGVLEFSGLAEISDLASFVRSLDTSNTSIMVEYSKLDSATLPAFESLRETIGKDQKIDDLLEVLRDARGVSFSFHENVFFRSGETALSAESYRLLDVLADAIADSPNEIIIMGHTDKTPVRTGRFNSNLELSVYRGMTVLDYFLNKKNLDPERFAVGGYGSWRPLKPHHSRIGDPANRRVEIIFKSTREI